MNKHAKFMRWFLSDNVFKVSYNKYLTQCTQHTKEFNYQELQEYFKKEYEI